MFFGRHYNWVLIIAQENILQGRIQFLDFVDTNTYVDIDIFVFVFFFF